MARRAEHLREVPEGATAAYVSVSGTAHRGEEPVRTDTGGLAVLTTLCGAWTQNMRVLMLHDVPEEKRCRRCWPPS